MIAMILSGCVGVYFLARVLRWVERRYADARGKELVEYRVRYGGIAVATAIAFLVSGVGEGTLSSPDYSYSWAYLVSGLIVFAFSVVHSFEMRRDARRTKADGDRTEGG